MIKQVMIPRILAILLGAIAVFSYAPFHYSLLAFFSYTGLLLLIADKTIKQAAIIGLCWGIGYFSSGVHWVYISIKQYGELPTIIALLILALLILYLSIYPLIFSLLLRLFRKFAPAYSIKQLVFLAPVIWQFTEFLRGYILGGFSWLQFGYSQIDSPLKGLFPLIGIDGVNITFSCLCGLLAYLSYHLFCTIQNKKLTLAKMHFFNASIALLVVYFAPLLFSLTSWTHPDHSRQVNIALIQGNIAQSLKWNRTQLNQTLTTYYSLTNSVIKSNDIVIWPEAAITDLETEQQLYLKDIDHIARENNSSVAVGIIDLKYQQDNYDIYNSLIVLGDKKPYQYPTSNRYLKHHLVPFGEYIPLQSLLEPISSLLNIPMSSMSSGSKIQKPLIMQGLKFTTVICYEAILSDLVLKNFHSDSDFILTVSNDAWFGDSIGPWQHLQMVQARALEFGRNVIRSTNNGITAFIDSHGNIIKQAPQFETTTLSMKLSPSQGLTPYATWGKLPYIILLGLLLSLFIIKIK